MLFKLHRLHHLADHTVSKDHNRNAVLVGNVKAFRHKVGRFLDARGRQHHQMVIAVSAALCRLEIISLRGKNPAESGPGTDDVYNQARKLGTRDIADALLLEADSRRG
ncbi:MAG: hypothetical protein DELT_03308 [Desulfovibrio sp.]